jgi:hypothetical protein
VLGGGSETPSLDFTILKFDVTPLGGFEKLEFTSEENTFKKKRLEFKAWLMFNLECSGVIRMSLNDTLTLQSFPTLIDFELARHLKASTDLSSAQYNAAEALDANFFGYDSMQKLQKGCVKKCGGDSDGDGDSDSDISLKDCSCSPVHPNRSKCLDTREFWNLCTKRVFDYLKTLVPESHQSYH